MIRISGGELRGRQIYCAKGKAIRPTTSFVRESLFSILGTATIRGARFLDLFAGCGIVGIEALSRGAAFVEAVESAQAHCRILEKNREHLHLPHTRYQITCQDVFAWIERHKTGNSKAEPFTLIFMDPPYAMEGADAVVEACFAHHLLAPDGLLIWESALKQPPEPQHTQQIETRSYGSSTLSFFKYPVLSES